MEAEEAGRRREGVWGAGARPLQRCLGLRLYPAVGGKTIAPLGPEAQGCFSERKVPDGDNSAAHAMPPLGHGDGTRVSGSRPGVFLPALLSS